MKTNRMGVAAIAFALAGCACLAPERVSTAAVDKWNPEVNVVGNVPQAPEALRYEVKEKGRITWHVKTDGYRFPMDGIVFEPAAAGEIVRCQRDNNVKKFTCDNLHERQGQKRFYKYTIKVEDDRGNPLTPNDPFVLND
jgi:hypothetical protein